MIFVELRFFFFFAAVFLVYWTLPRNFTRKLFLLVSSYVFYGAWNWKFLSLILVSTIVDYLVGLQLPKAESRQRRRGLLLCSLITNLGLLGTFKYFNFFVDSAADLLSFLGLQANLPTLNVILPVGISFYTFQTLSYTIDIYYKKLQPTRNFLDFALFVAFFPQLVAGPIVRAAEFLPQLHRYPAFAGVDKRFCMLLFLIGFVKKACIADNVAPMVDEFFAAPSTFTWQSTWLAVWLFAVQIYGDFSGYSDMAIATAGFLGFRLPKNFGHPYLATSITDFWRRWHISLSGWLRDYLYIPLGGNRGTKLFQYRNLMLTMLLGGLWHGAGWNFIIWGGLHGLALILDKIVHGMAVIRQSTESGLKWLFRGLGLVITFYWVCLAWIFFRAPTLAESIPIAKSYILLNSSGTESLGFRIMPSLAVFAAFHVVTYFQFGRRLSYRIPWPVFAFFYGVAFAFAFMLAAPTYRAFIYFQF